MLHKFSLIQSSYVDPAIYRDFVRRYGVALLYNIYPDDDHSRYTALKSESVLHAHGYTVNAKDNLSAHERQELLTTLVDLGIISIEKIVSILTFASRVTRKGILWLVKNGKKIWHLS